MTQLAPIALFVYNRPLHTIQTVEALKKNDLSSRSDLFIFSDAPKSASQTELVNDVREYIRRIDGFKSVTIIEREVNFGLAKSIIEGVTSLCNTFGNVIVLEDDLETSPFFLRFMNESLIFYKDIKEVMHISGCRYPAEQSDIEDTFFLHVPLCWGWATWQRAWVTFEKDIRIMDYFDNSMIKHFDFDNTYTFWKQLELNKVEKINTWFVFWYATVFLKNGLSLFPARSLVRNTGFDKSGIHCNETTDYDVELSSVSCRVQSIPIHETQSQYKAHVNYFRMLKLRPYRRVLNYLRRTVWKWIGKR